MSAEMASTVIGSAEALVVLVGFRNPDDLGVCLSFLAKSNAAPAFTVLICENGGREAYERLVGELNRGSEFCRPAMESCDFAIPTFRNVAAFELLPNNQRVLIGLAPDNLGFAGGVNAWLRVALGYEGWRGAWILNPDTMPEPDALFQLSAYAHSNHKGMVGSRIVLESEPNLSGTRGLHWRKFLASTEGIDLYAPLYPEPVAEEIEARLDSPSGASFYVTRECIDTIGLMSEEYFLFFEDLEWGIRAKVKFQLGYAFKAAVIHKGGTTIGSKRSRKAKSRLAVYLEFRNRLLFSKRLFPIITPWVALMSFARSFEFLFVRAFANFGMAMRGILAGLRGETGRPDALFPELRSRL